VSSTLSILEEVLSEYAALESDVRAMVSGRLGAVCELCTSCCCTPDICEESLDSAFLRLMRDAHPSDTLFSERFGWLTAEGCGLSVGRPPVCYEFYCNEIVDSFSPQNRQLMRLLGRLLTWVGVRAVGSQHLVEIIDDDALVQGLDAEKLRTRLSVAREAFSGVQNRLSGIAVSEAQSAAMKRIESSAQFDA
jgi:hypothetical protein